MICILQQVQEFRKDEMTNKWWCLKSFSSSIDTAMALYLSCIYSAYKTWSRRMFDFKPQFTLYLQIYCSYIYAPNIPLHIFTRLCNLQKANMFRQEYWHHFIQFWHLLFDTVPPLPLLVFTLSPGTSYSSVLMFSILLWFVVMVLCLLHTYGEIGLSFVSLTWKAAFGHSECRCPLWIYGAACDRSNRTCLPYYGKQA